MVDLSNVSAVGQSMLARSAWGKVDRYPTGVIGRYQIANAADLFSRNDRVEGAARRW